MWLVSSIPVLLTAGSIYFMLVQKIGVASTKAFTGAKISVLAMMALKPGDTTKRHLQKADTFNFYMT